MRDPLELLRLILLNLVVVAGITTAIGASAPRWPATWLGADRGPLRLRRFDQIERYRRWRLNRLGRALPEAGSTFGGKSKRVVPDRSSRAIEEHLVELRRGEWVHWLSNLSLLPLIALGPWWLTLAFAAVVLSVNFTFIGILRLNRLRYLDLRERLYEDD